MAAFGPQHDRRAIAISKQADDAGFSDRCRHLVASSTKPISRQTRRARLLHRQFRVRMHILIEVGQVLKHCIEVTQCRI
jgi:hypothetical protein